MDAEIHFGNTLVLASAPKRRREENENIVMIDGRKTMRITNSNLAASMEYINSHRDDIKGLIIEEDMGPDILQSFWWTMNSLQSLEYKSNCERTMIPPVIVRLTELEILKIPGVNETHARGQSLRATNKLTSVPHQIGKLSNLRILDLHGNVIETLPDEMRNLHNLVYLDLSNNRLHDLDVLDGMEALETLNVSFNLLDHLPIPIWGFPNLRELHAAHNFLKSIPGRPWHFVSPLREIDLSRNWFTEFPSVLTMIPTLKTLILSRNDIKEIPGTISALVDLEVLRMAKNLLRTLPTELANIPHIKIVDVGDNLITELPPELEDINDGCEIYYDGNPIEKDPPPWLASRSTFIQ